MGANGKFICWMKTWKLPCFINSELSEAWYIIEGLEYALLKMPVGFQHLLAQHLDDLFLRPGLSFWHWKGFGRLDITLLRWDLGVSLLWCIRLFEGFSHQLKQRKIEKLTFWLSPL